MALTDNLISVWELSEASGNAVDSFGSHTLTETSGTIAASSGPGILSGSRDIEANDSEWFEVADHSDLSGADVDLAVCGWFQIEAAGTRVVVSKLLGTGNQREWQVLTNGGFLRFSVSADGSTLISVTDTHSLSTGVWYWFCAWHDATANTINIQLNDNASVSQAHSTGIFNGTAGFAIGAQSGGGSPWDGLVTQIAFWKGRFPTSGERSAIYNDGNGLLFEDWAGAEADPAVDITEPTVFRGYQRLDGSATVTVAGTYENGTPTAIEVQINGGSWSTLDASPSGGTFSGDIVLPEGTNTVAVRWSNDTSVTTTVSDVLVGDVLLIVGQSNAAGRLTNDQTYTHVSQSAGMWKGGSWLELGDPTETGGSDGSPWPLFATQGMADQGVPIIILNYAVGGTAISTWWTTSAQTNWTAAKAAVTASGVNGLKAVLCDIGESDAINDTVEATFNSRMDGWADDVSSTYGCKLFTSIVGTTTGIDADGDLDAIRSAQFTAVEDNTNVRLGPNCIDRADLHWLSDAEGLVIAKRWWVAVGNALYGKSYGRGPRVVSVALNVTRTKITVVFDRTLKTGLTFAASAWTVLDDGTPATVSSVAYHTFNPNAVVLTLSGALSGDLDTCTVTFASGNDAAGVVIPQSEDISMPVGVAVTLPAEPFYAVAASEADPSFGTLPLLGV